MRHIKLCFLQFRRQEIDEKPNNNVEIPTTCLSAHRPLRLAPYWSLYWYLISFHSRRVFKYFAKSKNTSLASRYPLHAEYNKIDSARWSSPIYRLWLRMRCQRSTRCRINWNEMKWLYIRGWDYISRMAYRYSGGSKRAERFVAFSTVHSGEGESILRPRLREYSKRSSKQILQRFLGINSAVYCGRLTVAPYTSINSDPR